MYSFILCKGRIPTLLSPSRIKEDGRSTCKRERDDGWKRGGVVGGGRGGGKKIVEKEKEENFAPIREGLGWTVLKIYVALATFQLHRDFEAGDKKSLN